MSNPTRNQTRDPGTSGTPSQLSEANLNDEAKKSDPADPKKDAEVSGETLPGTAGVVSTNQGSVDTAKQVDPSKMPEAKEVDTDKLAVGKDITFVNTGAGSLYDWESGETYESGDEITAAATSFLIGQINCGRVRLVK